MKKTLITLLAMAGVAMGQTSTLTLKDALVHTQNGTSMNLDAESMTDSTTFTLTMKLDGTALAQAIYLVGQNLANQDIARIEVTQKGSSYDLGTGIVFGSATEGNANYKKAGIFAIYGKGGFTTKDYGWTAEDGSTVGFFSDILSDWGYSYDATTGTSTSSITGVAYTLTGTVGSNFSSYMVITLNDGSTLTYSGTTSGYSFSGVTDINSISFNSNIVKDAYMFDSVSNSATASALNKALLVPEPTTATLSLLALCGLAARRRRK